MNRDEIIRMARAAGVREMLTCTRDELERFAALVAAAEREECAKVCESIDEEDGRYRYDYKRGALACAASIRARGSE